MEDKKRGRPRKDVTRDKVTHVRFNENELSMARYFMIKDGDNFSKVIRKALRFYYYTMINNE